jgi:alpha,alpha-trehalase
MGTDLFISAGIDRALAHIDEYWSRLIRQVPEDNQTLIGLPHPYLVPSDGAMFQEMYYWDTYFMSLGLIGTRHEELIVGMVRNLAHLYKRFGIIPNASRYYFLSRSQPPLFTNMILFAHDILKAQSPSEANTFLREMILTAEDEHENVWMGEQQPHHRMVQEGLSRYFDINYLDALASCESGWDHSTRCNDRWLAHLPVDLNSILHMRELHFVEAWNKLGDAERAQRWQHRADNRAATIQELMWDKNAGFFFDFDMDSQACNPIPSLAGFFTMWSGLATKEQAARMVEEWLPKFEFEGGLVTALDQENGKQWAFPNGWAPLQWIVAQALDNYGFRDEARRVRRKWLNNCLYVFERTGAMWEKYNVVSPKVVPEGGLYGSLQGFGWSNSVFVDFARREIGSGL